MITFKSNGATYLSSTSMPKTDPSDFGLAFGGWYTTRTYEKGTEFTKVSQATSYNTTVYAKLLDYTKFTLAVGKTKSVAVKGASYKSSNSSVASVSSSGKITANKVGTANITVTASGKKTVYIIEVVPNKVTSLAVKQLAAGIQLTWAKDASAGGYYIYRSTNGGDYTKIATLKKNTLVKYTDEKTTNGSKYSYKIMAYKKVGTSILKSSFSSAATMFRLTKASISSAQNTAAGKITVTWKKNTAATGYQISYTVGNSKAVIKTVSGAATTRKILTSLKKGKTVSICVRAYKKVGSTLYYGKWSNTVSVKVVK